MSSTRILLVLALLLIPDHAATTGSSGRSGFRYRGDPRHRARFHRQPHRSSVDRGCQHRNRHRYSAASDAEGRFALDLLPPGDYSARVVAQGMSPQVTPQLHVDVGGAAELEFRLTVAGAHENVTVSAAPALVETKSSAVSTLLDERALNDIPAQRPALLRSRAVFARASRRIPRSLTSATNGDLSFGGIRGFQNSFLVDGLDFNNAFFAQARGRYRAPYQFSTEVVQEFRISTNSYGAEQGRSGGAVVNVVTKSGSNHLHGTAFYYLRDSSFGATDAFLAFKPHNRQQQVGGTIGGPLKRNKIFFFAGFDQHIFHVPNVVEFLDGSSQVVPQAGTGPYTPGDYEATDQALVFAAAAQLTSLAGEYPAAQIGNSSYAKLDINLTPRHQLALRVNTTRYWGSNNVFLDPGSPVTYDANNNNGQETVATETASLSLTSSFTPRWVSHLRAQFSRDRSSPTATPATCWSRFPPFSTAWDAPTFFPARPASTACTSPKLSVTKAPATRGSSAATGCSPGSTISSPASKAANIFSIPSRSIPLPLRRWKRGCSSRPLRAYAHEVPHYYLQNFGSATSQPNTNEYAAFAQDTIRVTDHLAVNLGVRWDLQTFTTAGLLSNPLFPPSGKVPFQPYNFAPRAGFAYSFGKARPLVVRAGYGIFYVRIPQIYNSVIQTDNGITDAQPFPQQHELLRSSGLSQLSESAGKLPALCGKLRAAGGIHPGRHQRRLCVRPQLRHPARAASEPDAGKRSRRPHHRRRFAAQRSRRTSHPRTRREPAAAHGLDLSHFRFHRIHLSGRLLHRRFLRHVAIQPHPRLARSRPASTLSAGPSRNSAPSTNSRAPLSSFYNGATLSINRRVARGTYLRFAFTYAHAIDDGQDALVAGQPATVQNSYAPSAERGPSVTDQRDRLVVAFSTEPRPFHRGHEVARPHSSTTGKFPPWSTTAADAPSTPPSSGDPNQDGNDLNDRLPGYSRNAFTGPDYATADLRLTRSIRFSERYKLNFVAESFNLFNRDNQRVAITSNGLVADASTFVQSSVTANIAPYPGYYQLPNNFMKPNAAYAPRQIQLALKFILLRERFMWGQPPRLSAGRSPAAVLPARLSGYTSADR